MMFGGRNRRAMKALEGVVQEAMRRIAELEHRLGEHEAELAASRDERQADRHDMGERLDRLEKDGSLAVRRLERSLDMEGLEVRKIASALAERMELIRRERKSGGDL